MEKGKNIMKKLIIVFISLMFANIAFAEMRLIEETKVGPHKISTVCIDGYKFVVFDRVAKEGISMVQYYKRGLYAKNTPPQPVQC